MVLKLSKSLTHFTLHSALIAGHSHLLKDIGIWRKNTILQETHQLVGMGVVEDVK